MKTAEEIAFDLASAAIDMMALHSPHTEEMMRGAIARWKEWQIEKLRRDKDPLRLRIPTTEQMVDRFLSWPLPETVKVDLCAYESDYAYPRYGTNLLSANEAREMIQHLHRVNSQINKQKSDL